jgi:hypothetical protein
MKHLKYFETYNVPTPEQDRVNNVLDKMLDKGKDSLTPEEEDILKNNGELPKNKKYIGIPNQLEFEVDKVENQGDELKVFGSLYYKNQEFYGWFTIPTIEDRRGQNFWDFVKSDSKRNIEFDPDPDDLYELDSMIQEIEFDFVDN